MKKFIMQLIIFSFFLFLTGEVIIRVFNLVSDIPERYADEYGVQRYKPGQSGRFKDVKSKWHVNDYGWVGTSKIENDTVISIIGDSYIENLMNPMECNQGSILKSYYPNYSFFEAGRSGVTFIEAMEITKILDKEVKPTYHLLYLNEFDFYESIENLRSYDDRLQVNLETNTIKKGQLKSPGLKKILYSCKLLYYMYLRFPIFVEAQNKAVSQDAPIDNITFDKLTFQKLFSYCSKNYDLSKIIFIFHPNTDENIISLAREYGIKTIVLNSKGDKDWGLGEHDGHWSCYGQKQVSKQIKEQFVLDKMNTKQTNNSSARF